MTLGDPPVVHQSGAPVVSRLGHDAHAGRGEFGVWGREFKVQSNDFIQEGLDLTSRTDLFKVRPPTERRHESQIVLESCSHYRRPGSFGHDGDA
jgi:hypothetical protein